MNYSERYNQLNSCFKQGVAFHLNETNINVQFFEFSSHPTDEEKECLMTDNCISENASFGYPVFSPAGKNRKEEAILLLHGLNERSWHKYLTWAEYLCNNTGKPVILFPIAFHMNRAPLSWSNPRKMMSLLNFRRGKYNDNRSMSFANVALSERLSQSPERFYLSGRQTWSDLTSLFEEIKTGRHPLFKEGTKIDIFAYSIGAFLSQVALMANQKNLFSDSRLFMFCGGSIFRSMQGISRNILDKPAFEEIQDYYTHSFGTVTNTTEGETTGKWKRDNAFKAFFSMITPERNQTERENFFRKVSQRIKGITLAKDKVIPYKGVLEALGKKNTESSIKLLDFSFPYTHENPFPFNTKDSTAVNAAFTGVFSLVTEFFQ